MFSFCFLGPLLQHMEVPRLGVTSELQLPAYTTTTAMQDPSCVCDLHHSSWQGIPEWGQGWNPHPHGYWSGLFPLNHIGNSYFYFLKLKNYFFFLFCCFNFFPLYSMGTKLLLHVHIFFSHPLFCCDIII